MGKKDPCFIYSGGNGPGKCRKRQVSWGRNRKWFAMEYTSAIFTLGFQRWNLYACPQEVKEAAYKGLVRPVLEYSGLGPTGVGLKNELQKIQNQAPRFITGNYNFETGSMTDIEHLKWESLKKRRIKVRRVKPVYHTNRWPYHPG